MGIFKSGHEITIVGVYAPTDDAEKQMKDKFNDELTTILSNIYPRKKILLLGDLRWRRHNK